MSSSVQALAAASTPPPASKSASPADGLGKDDFLKLLVGQLRNQNPMNPLGDQEFIAQMAAFSTLEQVTNLASSMQRLEESTNVGQTVGLVGREVTYVKADGTTASGTVERATFGDGQVTLTVGGVDGISPGMVTEIR
jgi:flagellar basal-body rod modification protein FlgD